MKVSSVLESEDKVDITPMIDVVFLLLIYFMFLPLQQEADIGIKLPSNTPPAENLELPSEHIVEIFPNGLILLNGAPMDGVDDRNMERLSKTLTRLKLSSARAGLDTGGASTPWLKSRLILTRRTSVQSTCSTHPLLRTLPKSHSPPMEIKNFS